MAGVEQLLAVARGELGYSEDPPGSNKTKYGAWYGQQDAWCGVFVSWCADQSGNTDVIPRFAYTPSGAAWFQQRGRFSRSPIAGSIAFYDLAGMGRISHCGIVESVSVGGGWYAIEGNTNGAASRTGGQVRRNYRTTVGTTRGGFGLPSWASQTPAVEPAIGYPTIRLGSTGAAVRLAQAALSRALVARNRAPIAIDGQFGPATGTAVEWFQSQRGLAPDGVVGPLTWNVLRA